jgi:nuclear transport factor 2 (NTF2) superfamily protein
MNNQQMKSALNSELQYAENGTIKNRVESITDTPTLHTRITMKDKISNSPDDKAYQ